ncbi:MAG: hypothetical protein ATN33_02770 [Epulopiscium sp. Nele67-Bin001]|nr:MAG: hypothetical protein ATN33_02770 [Epulopiscium sp. Nele67-Bin001]
MNKKILTLGIVSGILISTSLGWAYSIAEAKPANLLVVSIDFDDEYYVEDENGKQLYTDATLEFTSTSEYKSLWDFTSNDTKNFTITSASTNPGSVDVQLMKANESTAQEFTTTLSPEHSWITTEGLSGDGTQYSVLVKPTVQGEYIFEISW